MKYIFVLTLTLLSTVANAQDYKPDANLSWKGPKPHPAKRIEYLQEKVSPACGSLFIYYSAKGASPISKDMPVVLYAYCIRDTNLGEGANQFKACEVSQVNWDEGFFEGFYDGRARLFANGSCNDENLKKLNKEIIRLSETMVKKLEYKIAFMSDRLNFEKIYSKK